MLHDLKSTVYKCTVIYNKTFKPMRVILKKKNLYILHFITYNYEI